MNKNKPCPGDLIEEDFPYINMPPIKTIKIKCYPKDKVYKCPHCGKVI